MTTALRMSVAAALMLGASLGASTAAHAFDPWGVWVREDGSTKFDFYNCDNKLCAKVVEVQKADEKSGIGTVFLRNAEKKGDNYWAGEIYQSARTARPTPARSSSRRRTRLTLQGCLLGFLCKGETWKRDPDQKLASTPGGKPVAPAFKATPASAR